MEAFLILLPLVIVVVTVLVGLAQALFRSWLDYRANMAFLDKLETDPDKMKYASEVQDLIARGTRSGIQRQDFTVTGIVLGSVGLICFLFGLERRMGQLAVGLYLGGAACIVLGLVIALLGLLIRTLRKDPIAKLQQGE